MSMTIEEAIKRIQKHIIVHRIYAYPHVYIGEALGMAIDALKEKAEREDPRPLTIEELRQMDGEPVWVVWPDNRIKSNWWIPGNYAWSVMEFDDPVMERRYGETWIAYRHKPKDDAK